MDNEMAQDMEALFKLMGIDLHVLRKQLPLTIDLAFQAQHTCLNAIIDGLRPGASKDKLERVCIATTALDTLNRVQAESFRAQGQLKPQQ